MFFVKRELVQLRAV